MISLTAAQKIVENLRRIRRENRQPIKVINIYGAGKLLEVWKAKPCGGWAITYMSEDEGESNDV